MTFIPMKGQRLNPLLEEDLAKIVFPVMASPKLDGIRAVVVKGKLLSYQLKLIPNLHTQDRFNEFEGMDGELVINQLFSECLFRNTSSAVMSRDGKPDVRFHVFDNFERPERPFKARYQSLKMYDSGHKHVKRIRHEVLHDLDDLLKFEKDMLQLGYEGSIIRDPEGVYKFGRSTIKQRGLIKLTRRLTEEAKVVGFVERMKNNNPQERSEHGKAKRSSHKENKVGRGDLGALVVRNAQYSKDFEVGSGFTDKERAEIWDNKKKYLGKKVKYEFTPIGDYDVPRFPTFLGFRDRRD